jgi:hypothetical protein
MTQVLRCREQPLRFELQIFRLPGKGGYSIRTLGTTSSLIIWDFWVEVYVASALQREESTVRKGGAGEGAPPAEEEVAV